MNKRFIAREIGAKNGKSRIKYLSGHKKAKFKFKG
jgi:hypothetical protein